MAKKSPRRVAIRNPEIEITIVATISAAELSELNDSIESAVDDLRQYGSVEIVKRRVTAEVIEGGG